jgi:cobalamin biosynthesis Mg chelatase CobN
MKALFLLIIVTIFFGCASKKQLSETSQGSEISNVISNNKQEENSSKTISEQNKTSNSDSLYQSTETTIYGVFEDSKGNLHVFPKTKTKTERGRTKKTEKESETKSEESSENVQQSNNEENTLISNSATKEELKEPGDKKTAFWLGFITVPVLVVLFLLLYFKIRK